MKLISLNAWCGVLYEPLMSFLQKEAVSTDLFCLQEIRNGEYEEKGVGIEERPTLFHDIEKALPGFVGYFSEMVTGVGLAIFVRREIAVDSVKTRTILAGEEIAHLKMVDGHNYYPRLAQSLKLADRDLVIHNFHGVPKNKKQDTPERELQNKRLFEMFNEYTGQQIIVGDFNLDISTKAIAQLDRAFRNLVKENRIGATRSRYYDKLSSLPFADYAFVTNDLKILDFRVLPDEISDHLALSLKFV